MLAGIVQLPIIEVEGVKFKLQLYACYSQRMEYRYELYSPSSQCIIIIIINISYHILQIGIGFFTTRSGKKGYHKWVLFCIFVFFGDVTNSIQVHRLTIGSTQTELNKYKDTQVHLQIWRCYLEWRKLRD